MKKSRYILPVLLICLFAFRLLFGITSTFWMDDEKQVYLIGLKYFCTGHFPFFGPDVVYTGSQIPGALQGLLVGIPFFLFRIPEAPYILINILSFGTLCLLALYIRKIVPSLPSYFVWIWVLTCPWVMTFSTNIVNPSYALPAGIIFFISFLELVPRFRVTTIKAGWLYAAMGFAITWIMQLHLSWIILIPFLCIPAYHSLKKGFRPAMIHLLLFSAGLILPALVLIPTYLEYGMGSGSGNTGSNIVFNLSNFGDFFTLLSRFLSLGSFEIPRFLGSNTELRLAFLNEYLWAAPFIVYVTIAGILQPISVFAACFFRGLNERFRSMRWLLVFAFFITWFSFFFSVKGPSSHTFYILFPLIMIFSIYAWEVFFKWKIFRVLMIASLAAGFVFHIALGIDNYQKRSLYTQREVVTQALAEKDYTIMGERRPWDRNQ
ncbi:MAG: hypothetical protein V2A54_05875 [Bacteroidota bacterium]